MPYKFEVFWTQYRSDWDLSVTDTLRVVDEKSAKRQIAILLKRKGVSNIGVSDMSDKFTVSWSEHIPFGKGKVGSFWQNTDRRFDSEEMAIRMVSVLQARKNTMDISIKPTLIFEEEKFDWTVKYFQMARLMYATEKKVILMETRSN